VSVPVKTVLSPHVRDLGGFSVRRLLPSVQARMIGPFIFFDHLGPADFPPGVGMDVRPHPHIGLATVTYLFEGIITHRDSLGSNQEIVPGDVNWMTAGRGIVHSERTPEPARSNGFRMHGIQTWVALPEEHQEIEPSFFHHPASALPVLEANGVKLRVIAGNAFGLDSPVRTLSEVLYAAAEFSQDGELVLPAEHDERAVYLLDGDLTIEGMPLAPQHMAVLESGVNATLRSAQGARVMMLGGAALQGERLVEWNFVSSRRERIEQARLDWREQRFGHVPGETEWIPLPEARA
jgi:redox-sensitive bicupin YhaK (pirin superfamily)